MAIRTKPRAALIHARSAGEWVGARAHTELDWVRSRGQAADLAVFHDYAPPPSGGGNQFLHALRRELAARGLRVEQNQISGGTRACLYNSFNFDFLRLRRFARRDCRMVHRVDGPIGVYRGFDDGTDRRILAINHALADATVFQSRYSLEKHVELGYELRDPVVIHNAPDPAIFHREGGAVLRPGERVRLIATSWSANPRKGVPLIAELEQSLDPERYALTFVGRAPVSFSRARVVPPVPSDQLAALLREHHIFVFASLNEACSNALLEALACGLPTLYVDSGSNRELVGRAGLAFGSVDDGAARLEELVQTWEGCRGAIRVPSLSDVADRYLEVLRP